MASVVTEPVAPRQRLTRPPSPVSPSPACRSLPKSSWSPSWGVVLAAGDRALPPLIRLFERLDAVYRTAEPFKPEFAVLILVGMAMVYFGGTFMALIAAAEAYRITSWEQSIEQVKVLKENFQAAWTASKKDDLLDEDEDGIADVKQISKEALVKRKIQVWMKSVQPMEVYRALGILYIGFIAVLSTLRIQFAQTITLGSSLGVIVAWTLRRIIVAFHSALRGAELLMYGAINWLKAMNLWEGPELDLGNLALFVQIAIAFTGLVWQFTHGFGLPWFLQIPLFPLSVIEWLLVHFIAA